MHQITVLTEFLKIVGKMGALSKAKVLSGATHYPVLRHMSAQWATEENTLNMCSGDDLQTFHLGDESSVGASFRADRH